MGFNLNPIVRTVSNMILRYGGECTVIVPTEGAYNYETSSVDIIETPYIVKMIAFDYLQRLAGTGAESNSLIRNGDKQIFMMLAAGQPLPNPVTDSVVYKGIKHNIITVKDINPSGLKSYILEVFCRE